MNFTQEQQLYLVNGSSFFGAAELPEADVPRIQLLDGGTGMNYEQLFGDFLSHAGLPGIGGDALRAVLAHFYEPEQLPDDDARKLHAWIVERLKERNPDFSAPGCYPPGMLLGATWNPDVVHTVGQALGQEARVFGVHVLLGTPNVNLHRDPRNGRAFEGYSEDPYLVTALAPSLVTGVQEMGVAANVKHFAANHQETNRLGVNEHISERALQELYYPGFRACVDAGVATVMSAYNQINGIPCTENKQLLTDMLRNEWGFDGLVMSDWGAVYHPAAAVNAGNDLAMPGPIPPDTLRAALADGTLDADALRQSAERVARLAKDYSKPAAGRIDIAATDAAAYRAAVEGIVMLKNDRACCPLSPHAKIALCGDHPERLLTCGEGSAGINTTRNVSLLDALTERFAAVQIGCYDGADTLVYVYHLKGQEGTDRADIGIAASVQREWEQLLTYAKQRSLKTVLLLNISAPVALGAWQDAFDSIFCCFLPGMQGANAIADLLCGKENPSGKLPLTFPAACEQMPTYLHFPGDGMDVWYGEDIFVGYRWYDARKITPAFCFGHGLSYTQFALSDLQTEIVSTAPFRVNVTVTVQNIGSCTGKTVVQLYVGDPHSTLTKPIRELKAFCKPELRPGESQTLTFPLEQHAFESYDPNRRAWTMEEGHYTISVGFSSADLPLSADIYADVESPYRYGAATDIKQIIETPALCQTVRAFFDANGYPWSAILTCYEYTAQDTIDLVLTMQKCPDALRQTLYTQMSAIPKT